MACPQWLFDLAHMEGANHPEVFATLGMVIGLYGVLYLSVAADPEQGWLIAAVGMTGKTLGPAGLALLLIRGTWPPATIMICLTNDLIWWLPFARYLRDARPQLRRARAPGGWDAGPGRVLRQSRAPGRPQSVAGLASVSAANEDDRHGSLQRMDQ